jgi:hypothetical protein
MVEAVKDPGLGAARVPRGDPGGRGTGADEGGSDSVAVREPAGMAERDGGVVV